jgi:DNA-binding IclR family transcriptional regulator
MPRPRVAMRRIKEVLRLKQLLGLSDAAISRAAGIARSTVKQYLETIIELDLDGARGTGAAARLRTRLARLFQFESHPLFRSEAATVPT